MMNRNLKSIKINPELEKLLEDIKFECRLPNIRGVNQIAQIKLVEFAQLGRETYKKNKRRLKSPNPNNSKIVSLLDSISP